MAEPEPEKEGRKAFVMNSTLRDLMRLPALRLALPLIQKIAERESGEFISGTGSEDMILDSPLRQLPMGTDGKISARQVKGIVEIFNGRVLKGLKLLAGRRHLAVEHFRRVFSARRFKSAVSCGLRFFVIY